jgi:hypothetical protein
MARWFSLKEAHTQGVALAQFFIERNPIDKLGDRSVKKQRETIVKIKLQAAQYKQLHVPNFMQRAKLLHSFKWTLYDAGYERGFVDDLTQNLMLR